MNDEIVKELENALNKCDEAITILSDLQLDLKVTRDKMYEYGDTIGVEWIDSIVNYLTSTIKTLGGLDKDI